MTAAIYARKSTEQNGVAEEQRSVARQVEHARAYAARKGWTVAPDHPFAAHGVGPGHGVRRERRRLFDAGKKDFECGARIQLALDFDPAVMLFDDPVNRGQSESGALTDFLRGKERLEDFLQVLWINAAAGVGDSQADKFAGARLGIVSFVRFIHRDAGGRDNQLPAFRHRIARIDREIQNDLLELSGVPYVGCGVASSAACRCGISTQTTRRPL